MRLLLAGVEGRWLPGARPGDDRQAAARQVVVALSKVAEDPRSMILERQREGIALAKANLPRN